MRRVERIMSGRAVQSAWRGQIVAWLALGCAVALSATFMSVAATTTREPRRAIGNGVARYIDVTTTSDTKIAAAAWLTLAAGAGAWAWIFGRSSGTGRRVPTVLAAIVALVTGYLWVAAPLLAGDGFSDSERYSDVPAVIGALHASGMPCTALGQAPNGDAELFADSQVCRQPNPADIRDGHDEVIVATFAVGSARDRWTAQVRHDDVYAVIGPRWVATCDFQATCARIQAAIGGRNY
jgi:hypothetical protein